MTLATMGVLAGLALLDSTSFGTLGIPVFMLIQARVRVAAILLYLLTISAFYWLVGLVLAFGASQINTYVTALEGNRTLDYVQLAIGVGLFALSYQFDKKRVAQRKARRAAQGAEPSRHERWKASLVGEQARPGVVVAVALGAGLVEVASMLPYLGAVGIITQAQLPAPSVVAILAAYVLVMTLPALALLALRLLAHRAIEPALRRLGAWLDRNTDEMLGWILGIVGFFVAADAAARIWW